MSTPSLTTPPSGPLDAFGEPLRLHDQVVFNQGGALNMGRIVRITAKRKPSCTPALLPISRLDTHDRARWRYDCDRPEYARSAPHRQRGGSIQRCAGHAAP